MSTVSLNLFKSTGTGANVSKSNSSTLLFKLSKSLGTFFNLLISSSSTSHFKLAKSASLTKSDLSTPAAFLSQILLHN